MSDARQAYALARLAARHGMLVRGAERALLSASRGADRYLEILRQTRLLAPPESVTTHDVDAFELYLVGVWRDACVEVAAWHPPRWRPAYRWCECLADLTTLESLRLPGAPSGWARADRRLGAVAAAEDRAAALSQVGLAPLAAAFESGNPLVAAWRDHWRRLWPAAPRATLRRLDELEALCADASGAEVAVAERRARLAEQLERLYRRSLRTAAAGFCELARRALDLEAWRGGFASRLYAPVTGDAAP